MIERPRFWRWTRLRVDRDNYYHVLQSDRVNIVPEIRIVVDSCPASVILNIIKDLFTNLVLGELELKRLHIAEGDGSELVDLPSLDPVLVSQALVRLEECSFRPSTVFRPMSTVQLVSLFTAIDQTNSLKLKTLNLPNQDYSQVPPEVLAAALVRLEDTNILVSPLSPLQVSSLFTKMAESRVMNIKMINLDVMNCSNISPELFGEALVRTTSIIKFHNITQEQVGSLFSKIVTTEDLRLRALCLYGCLTTISHIPPDIVAVALARLERFCTFNAFPSGNLTTAQISALLTRLSTVEDTSLRSLSVRYKNLSSVPTDLLVAGISGLEEVKLRFTRLTAEQITEIYRMVADRRCPRLNWINLGGNDLSSVPQDLRDNAKLNHSVFIID